MGLFGAAHKRGGRAKRPPFLKSVIYHTMMKLGIVIPNPKKIQKIYESRDTTLQFC